MAGIKSFLYLDEYKMYSISSQILEGLTESLINIRGASKEGEERQSGRLAVAELLQRSRNKNHNNTKENSFTTTPTHFLNDTSKKTAWFRLSRWTMSTTLWRHWAMLISSKCELTRYLTT